MDLVFHRKPGIFDPQIHPPGNQFLESLVVPNLLPNLRNEWSSDIVGSALHLMGITELMEGARSFLRIPVLAGQGAGTDDRDPMQLLFDGFDLLLNLL